MLVREKYSFFNIYNVQEIWRCFHGKKTGITGLMNGGKHSFYVESSNLQDTVINNPNPSIQKGVGYDQIDLTNKILFTPTSKSRVIINSQFSKSSNLARFDQLNNYDLSGAPEYSQWDYGPQKRILNSISISTRNRSVFFEPTLVFQQKIGILKNQEYEVVITILQLI